MPKSLPALGFGTYKLDEPEDCVENVQRALETGYRHIDTAQVYGNEAYVGDGIEESAVPREEVFLATKIDTENLAYEDVLESVEVSREKLGVETIDLLYVHWPTGEYDAERTLEAFDDLVANGTIEHVGLSNFRVDQLEEAQRVLDAPIFAHQVECHPLLPQERLARFAAENDHRLVAYSPIARGEVTDIPAINDVAGRHGATATQVALAWLVDRGIHPIPKASGEHIEENYRALELVEELTEADIEKIDGIEGRERLIDPENAPWSEPPAAE
ncbi:aldo/keto reductase [Halalkalicoccus jeotgali]|uniref:Aldehyde reductase n=1 Tax=Halalkalicoccus jeotgali (strain DSM 18796 / CECT 7217 / JCM 14584 / KCTC 4019 / B3) TaxID=795797 RepID=D8J3Y3_HALJB|nr:aldo/keto reductase [Halalkalicoccus jeotgali]ADJ15375.1 aldehyde reductase [Halalkalicoccus jeotgali B3]ELY35412.1 aldehyde reductase [Halalkalicoccus jeotgali B3]